MSGFENGDRRDTHEMTQAEWFLRAQASHRPVGFMLVANMVDDSHTAPNVADLSSVVHETPVSPATSEYDLTDALRFVFR